MLKMELTRDERAALAEEYIIMTLDKYKAEFADRYNRSQEPGRLLKMEREAYDRVVNEEANTRNRGTPDGKPVTVTAIGHKYLRFAGSRWTWPAKYTDENPNPYGWGNNLAGWINRYVTSGSRGDIADAVTFTEIVPGETSFTEGDAVAVYRYFKWLEAGKIGPEITTKPDPKEQILKMFLVRRDGSGGVNEFYRAVVATVPKVDGGEYAEGTIKNYHSKWMKRPAWITPVLISRIIKGLETEGQPIDYQYLDAINRHW
jgi:hypothetical protein